MRRRGLTLFELIAVLAIFAIVTALAAVGIQKAKAAAIRSDCQNRLRNLSSAVFHYESRTGRLPPGSISGPFAPHNVPEDVNHSLWGVLLGELDQPAAAAMYQWDVNYDDPLNQHAVSAIIPILLCPAYDATRVERWSDGRIAGVSDYAPLEVNPFLADLCAIDPGDNFEGPLPINGTVVMNDITDGASNTVLLAEAGGRPGMAWSSSDIPVSIKYVVAGGVHGGVSNAIMCDGSIRVLSNSIDLRVLARLATRSGNERSDLE